MCYFRNNMYMPMLSQVFKSLATRMEASNAELINSINAQITNSNANNAELVKSINAQNANNAELIKSINAQIMNSNANMAASNARIDDSLQRLVQNADSSPGAGGAEGSGSSWASWLGLHFGYAPPLHHEGADAPVLDGDAPGDAQQQQASTSMRRRNRKGA